MPYNNRHQSSRQRVSLQHLPLYRLVMLRLMKQLADGVVKPGQLLPSEFELADQLGVSQGTVRKGLDGLVARRILSRQQGVGTMVTRKNWDWGDYALLALPSLRSEGAVAVWPAAEVLSVTTEAADDETSGQLKLRPAEAVWKIMMLWRYGYEIIALDEIFLPQNQFPDLNLMYTDRRSGLSIFLLKQYDVLLNASQQTIWMQPLSTEQVRLLKYTGAPHCMCWGQLSVGMNGARLEWRRRYLNLGPWMLEIQQHTGYE